MLNSILTSWFLCYRCKSNVLYRKQCRHFTCMLRGQCIGFRFYYILLHNDNFHFKFEIFGGHSLPPGPVWRNDLVPWNHPALAPSPLTYIFTPPPPLIYIFTPPPPPPLLHSAAAAAASSFLRRRHLHFSTAAAIHLHSSAAAAAAANMHVYSAAAADI